MEKKRKDLLELLKELHLPTFRETYEEVARQAEEGSWGYESFLFQLAEKECQERRGKRIERLLHQSKLPLEKSIESFDMKRLPLPVFHKVRHLLTGSFLDRKENVLAFGNPGSGKTHLLCAIGQKLVRQSRPIYFTSSSLLVQKLLGAKRDLDLARLLKKLSRYQAIIIDDIGYVQQSREEMEVFFTLLAERYERGSVMLTSNLAFSKWERIFKDPMTTAAAIDRLVHHSVILELNLPSYRLKEAEGKNQSDEE
ncbi:MAG: IS21-like element helper ATPase IstB [Candidatus Aerophobetes bacterium]|nr:IS21-like element helper ATPase IstB [Candidatus Aerophobetes bacterium]